LGAAVQERIRVSRVGEVRTVRGRNDAIREEGKYVYYRCTKYRGKCAEKGIREERLAELLGEPLKRLRMTKERV